MHGVKGQFPHPLLPIAAFSASSIASTGSSHRDDAGLDRGRVEEQRQL